MDQSMRASLQALNFMLESEKTVAEFYLVCSERFTEHYTFWVALAREELAHARVIGKLIEVVNIQPSEFTLGKTTRSDAIQSFIKRTQSNIETLNQNELSEDKALLMAYHIENTIIELRFADVVDTQNEKYQALLAQVVADTRKHRDRVVARIKTLRQGSRIIKESS